MADSREGRAGADAGLTPSEVPVYSPDARLLFYAPPEWVRACAGNPRLVVSRRGVI